MDWKTILKTFTEEDVEKFKKVTEEFLGKEYSENVFNTVTPKNLMRVVMAEKEEMLANLRASIMSINAEDLKNMQDYISALEEIIA